MALLTYNLGIKIYFILAGILSIFNKKAKLFVEGRKNNLEKIALKVSGNSKKLVWFHCSSLGEFEQARPVIEGFKFKNPDYYIFLTFYSPSGYEARKNYKGVDAIFYLPMDSKKNARRLIQILKPTIVFFVKYDFWYHYLNELNKLKIPTILFSAIFRKKQLFFKSYGSFYRKILFNFKHIFVQDPSSRQLLNSIGYHQVVIAGDTRFDRVMENYKSKRPVELVEKFKKGQKLIVAGSTWNEDTEILIPFINEFSFPIKVIIAPHEIKENYLAEIEKKLKKRAVRYSEVNGANIDDYDILIIDNVGMLSSLYQYGEFAYVGGGFSQGLHNILEPAVFSLPVIFGPEKDFEKFPEASALINFGGAISVSTSQQLQEIMQKLYQDEGLRFKTGEISKKYIEDHVGATEKILAFEE